MVLSLGACAVGPNFSPPDKPTEEAYLTEPISEFGSAGPGEKPQRLLYGEMLRNDWWTLLNSPDLDQAVQLALANNKTLMVARANVSRAEQEVAVARGGLYPRVDAAGSVSRRQYGASFLGPEAATFPVFSADTVGINVSYDLDLFGGTHRSIELAQADAEIEREGLNAARLNAAAMTVNEAVQIASIRAQIGVLNDVVVSDQKTLELVKTANSAGVATRMDVTTAQSQLDRDRAMLPNLQQQLNVSQDSLAILVGKSPATWNTPEFSLAKITLPQDIPLLVPSDIVRARPDIRAAEAQLHAASAAIGVATADLYPHITLSAAVAEEGLVSGAYGPAWSLIGGLAGPIFHGGALSAQLHAAEDTYQATFAQYQQTVLVAFQQVADNLHGLANSADSVRTQQQALDSSSEALRLTRLGYGVGNAGILQVLDAQRLQQLAELGLVQARTQRYVQIINLFVATGGGLSDPQNGSASR